MASNTTKVLIVDDSAAMRQLLTHILTSDPSIEVVGTAGDPFIAREKIIKLQPDVITLDIEMPRMDGITFLEKLMRGRPMPVVMISSLTQKSADITMRALELGAVDFIAKPSTDTLSGVESSAAVIIEKVKAAARAKVRPRSDAAAAQTAQTQPMRKATTAFRMTHQIIAIGASTGGTEAIREVLSTMPSDAPGIVIVQHMPAGFTTSFAARLDATCAIRVKEAADGDRVLPGHALLAPGSFHMSVIRSGAETRVRVSAGPPVNLHKPSVDVLFESCAQHCGRNTTAAILTGMGYDGADGMKQLRDAGAHTLAQDEESCTVYGMPKEAVARGGVEFVLPLGFIGRKLYELAMRPHQKSTAA